MVTICFIGSVLCGNAQDDWAKVSRLSRHSLVRRRKVIVVATMQRRTELGTGIVPHVPMGYTESERMSDPLARHGLTFLHASDSDWRIPVCLRVDLFQEPPGLP